MPAYFSQASRSAIVTAVPGSSHLSPFMSGISTRIPRVSSPFLNPRMLFFMQPGPSPNPSRVGVAWWYFSISHPLYVLPSKM
jgi:hypothetical protein